MQESVGPQNIPGYRKVQDLATELVLLRDQNAVSKEAAERICALYQKLDEYDRRGIAFQPRRQDTLKKGRFKRPKSAVFAGSESTRR